VLSVAAGGALVPRGFAAVPPPPRADHHLHLFSPAIHALSPANPVLDSAAVIAALDEAGIARGAVLSIAYQFANPNRPTVPDELSKVQAENDWTRDQVARYRRRLRFFCSVNPLRPYALDEIERCARASDAPAGVKLHFGNSDVDLLSPSHAAAVRGVLSLANRLRLPLVIHLRSTINRNRPYGKPQIDAFLELLRAAPDVTVQIAHLGTSGPYADPPNDEAVGALVEAFARSDPRVARVLLDASGVVGLGPWQQQAARIAERVRQLGPQRVLFGSDGTANLLRPRDAWNFLRQIPLTETELATIATNVAPYLQ
jgi:predicted TIM-barrel fold metal-dependent hydrolase